MEKTDLKIKLKLGQRLGYDGKSAYQIWLEQGNSGTEDEFLASLKGKQGEKGNDGAPGAPGEKGDDGADGKSAYRQWLDAGNTGTEDDFLASLKGERGEKGEKGDPGSGVMADEEDLTIEEGKVALKDKTFSESAYSGLGRVYLRKNMQDEKNVLTQEMLSAPHTRYIIQYSYDLNGKCLVVPDDSALVFEGGSFRNGSIKGRNIVIESRTACFDHTLAILPGSLADDTIYLRWFKMEEWSVTQYAENHKNKNAFVSPVNRMIVNRHLRYRLVVPSGIFPFDDEIPLVEQFSEFEESFDSGCSLNMQGTPFSEFTGRFNRSAFVFPRSRGFVWKYGLGNAINNVKHLYLEAEGNIFHLWDNYDPENKEDRTPNAMTNSHFYDIEMVSWSGSGFFSPSNYRCYIYFNKFRNIKGWFPSEKKGFFEGLSDMCNVYDVITLLYMGLDKKPFKGNNFSVFVNQTSFLNQGNFDSTRYVLYYAGTTPEFQQRYENQNAFFFARRSQFEGVKDAVVYTEGPYVSIGIDVRGCSLVWFPEAVSKPVFDVSRLRFFKHETFFTVGVDKAKMLNINSPFGGDNVIDSDVDLVVPYKDNAALFVPGRSKSSGNEDLSFITLTGRTNPQQMSALRVDFLSAGVLFSESQEVTDDIDFFEKNETLKSRKLVFKKTQPFILPYILPCLSVFTAKNFEGEVFNITNDGAKMWIVTDRGNIEVPRGVSLNLAWSVGGFKVLDASPKKLKGDSSMFPMVFDGDIIVSDEAETLYIIKERQCGIFALGGDMQRSADYTSQKHASGVYIQHFGKTNTAVLGQHVFCCVQAGTTAPTEPSFDLSDVGAETADGSVVWRLMGRMPIFIEK